MTSTTAPIARADTRAAGVGVVEAWSRVVAALEKLPKGALSLRGLDDSTFLSVNDLQARAARLLGAGAAVIAGEIAYRSRPALGMSGLAQRSGFRTSERGRTRPCCWGGGAPVVRITVRAEDLQTGTGFGTLEPVAPGTAGVDNGILLCRWHHLKYHNEGYEIERDAFGNYWQIPPTTVDPEQKRVPMPLKSNAIRRLWHHNQA